MRSPASRVLSARVLRGLMLVAVLGGGAVFASARTPPLVLDNFDEAKNVNAFGGATGAWYDPEDPSVGCAVVFDTTTPRGREGASLRLDYNIATVREHVRFEKVSQVDPDGRYVTASPSGKAFNGYYSVFPPRDLSDYRYLSFWVRGDPARGFPRSFKIELKDSRSSASKLIDGVTSRWQRIVLPLSAFKEIKDWTSIQEFVVVFSEDAVNRSSGTVYLDDIYFAGDPQDVPGRAAGGNP